MFVIWFIRIEKDHSKGFGASIYEQFPTIIHENFMDPMHFLNSPGIIKLEPQKQATKFGKMVR